MKKILSAVVLGLLIAAVFVVPVFAQDELPPDETAPTIPLTVDQFPWVSVLLVAAVTWVVTEGVKSISKVFGIDISGKASAIIGTVVLTLVELINGLLAAIPPEAIPSVTAGLGFVFTLLSAFGIAGFVKKILTKPEVVIAKKIS